MPILEALEVRFAKQHALRAFVFTDAIRLELDREFPTNSTQPSHRELEHPLLSWHTEVFNDSVTTSW